MSSKDAQALKSTGRYLLESLARIIKERRENRDNSQAELGVPREGDRIFLPTSDLLQELNNDEEAPWKESKKGVLTGHRLAALLGEYGVKAGRARQGKTSTGSTQNPRGYWSDDLEKAIQKYASDGF